MLVFISPLLLPFFAASADPEASLPACCRRHGKHHCNMTAAMMATLAASSGPALTTSPCPLYPTAAAPVRIVTAYFAVMLPATVELRRNPAPPAPTPFRIPHPHYLLELHPRPSRSLRLSARNLTLIPDRPTSPRDARPCLVTSS